jgi:hypothetical protein
MAFVNRYVRCRSYGAGRTGGSRSYKDIVPTGLVGERLFDQNAELTARADIIADSAKNSLK